MEPARSAVFAKCSGARPGQQASLVQCRAQFRCARTRAAWRADSRQMSRDAGDARRRFAPKGVAGRRWRVPPRRCRGRPALRQWAARRRSQENAPHCRFIDDSERNGASWRPAVGSRRTIVDNLQAGAPVAVLRPSRASRFAPAPRLPALPRGSDQHPAVRFPANRRYRGAQRLTFLRVLGKTPSRKKPIAGRRRTDTFEITFVAQLMHREREGPPGRGCW